MVKLVCAVVGLFALVGGIGLWAINNPERVKKTLASASPIPAPADVPKVTEKPDQKPAVETFGAKLDEWVSLGLIRVRVTGIRIGHAELRDWQGNVCHTDNNVTIVGLDIENTSKTKLVRLESWNADRKSAGQSARATDAHGLGYGSIDVTGSSRLNEDHLPSSSDIAPKQAVKEQIVLRECRTEHAGYLDIELPAANVGESGAFRFRIGLKSQKEFDEESRKVAIEKQKEAREKVAREQKTLNAKGILHLKSKTPVLKGVSAWVCLDGKPVEPWPEGATEVRLTVQAKAHRLTITSEYQNKERTIVDMMIRVSEDETTTLDVNPAK